MAKIEVEVLQKLYDQVTGYKKAIDKAGSDKKNRLSSTNYDNVVKIVPTDTNKITIDKGQWDGTTEDDQVIIFQTLDQLCRCLQNIVDSNGPKNPKHIMYDEYASNFAIIFMLIIAMVLNIYLFYQIKIRWNESITPGDVSVKTQTAAKALYDQKAASEKLMNYKVRVFPVKDTAVTKKFVSDSAKKVSEQVIQDSLAFYTNKAKETDVIAANATIEMVKAMEGSPDEKDVLFMVLLLGALGGSIHFLTSLVKFVGNRLFKRSWIIFYFSMPVTGAGLALIVYMLLRIGILNPSGTSGSGTAISNLNLIAIYAFSVLSGLFSKTAIEKLAEVFNTLFKTTETKSKDALGPDSKKVGG